MQHTLFIHSDGGSRGNPGQAAIGYVAEEDAKTIHEGFKAIGVATNNEAEHLAIQEALRWVLQHRSDVVKVVCFLDSELVVRQLSGRYKIKNERLVKISGETFAVLDELKRNGIGVEFASVPREQNRLADKLVNKALDEAGF